MENEQNDAPRTREQLLAMAVSPDNLEQKGDNKASEDIENEKNLQEDLDKTEEIEYNQENGLQNTDADVIPEAEQRARRNGWRPKEEYAGNPDIWVDYEEFNRQTPLYEAIKDLKKDLKGKDKALESLLNTFKKRERSQFENEIINAKALRQDAIKRGDVASVETIDEFINKKSEELKNPDLQIDPTPEQIPAQNKQLHPAAQAFIDRHANFWYGSDAKAHMLREYAVKRDQEIIALNPTMPRERVYQILEQEILTMSGNNIVKKSPPPPAEGVTREKGATNKLGYGDLNPDQKKVYHIFKNKGRDPQVYIEELVKSGELVKKR